MSRKIVFVNQAAGYLTIDIINAFSKQFDEIALIYGEIRIQDINLNPKVVKSKIIEKKRDSNLSRFNRWFIGTFQIYYLLITKYRHYEIFYFSIPPFAYLISLFLKRRFSILMWDIYPDALKMIGISERNIIFRTWASANRILFKRAYRIYTIGEGLAKLLSKYVAAERIIIIPVWSGITNFIALPKESNPFIIEHGLKEKFIIQYSGNIGSGHNIESLLEAAKQTISDPDILFLIIGRGMKVNKVRGFIADHQLHNCLLLPFQPDDCINYTLSAADLSVVLIEDELAQVSIPSKVYNIMKVGSAMVTIAPKKSELNKIIQKYGNGCNFEKKDITGLVEFIISMKNEPEKLWKYKQQSLKASSEFTFANATRFFESYIS